jgi:HEAT repeat protein
MNAPETNGYEEMDINDRRLFLAGCVHENTSELSERFLLWALNWEKDPKARWFLIKAVGIMELKSGLPSLLQICQQPDVNLEHTSLHAICAWSLGRIGNSATNALIKLMANEDSETRRCAADALGEIGASSAISALSLALMEDDRQVKLWAGLSLAKIGPESIPFLERAAIDPNEATRLIALDALRKIEMREAK